MPSSPQHSSTAPGLLRVHIPCNASSTSGCSPSVCSISSSANDAASPSFQLPSSPRPSAASTTTNREEWFSLEGYLQMKCLSNAFVSLLQSRKRLYFGLEEVDNRLIYYRSKADFDVRKDCLGQIAMAGAFCSLVESNMRAFVLHTSTGKKFQFEADNERAADCWLNALQQRREGTNAAGTLNRGTEGPLVELNAHRRHRSRSKSFGHSDSDSDPVGLKRHRPRACSQQHAPRRRLPPLRLDMLNGSASGLETISASTPTTPLSMPAATHTCFPEGGLSRRKISHAPLRKTCSVAAGGTNQPVWKELSDRGESNGCTCGRGQWVMDSWLWDQQRLREGRQEEGNGLDKMYQKRSAPEPMATMEAVLENGHHEEQHADASNSVSSLPLLDHLLRQSSSHPTFTAAANSSAQPESPSPLSDSSNTCESAGAMERHQREKGSDNELDMLRALSNRQKAKIAELSAEVERLKKVGGGSPETGTSPHEHSMATQNRFLNAELLRINERKLDADKKTESYKEKIAKLEAEMEDFKKEYVHLLQSCVRIPLRENSACDVVQVKLFGGDEHEKRVKKLLERARDSDPTLPTFESVTRRGSFHVDEYGFRHSFEEVPLAVHFIATQLHQHYQSQSADQVALKAKWRALLELQPEHIERNQETRHLCRRGIPRSLRSRVWRILINQQVADLKAKHGPYYYRDLCSTQGTPAEKHYSSAHQKQVNLDLLRTMPGNVHFMSASCKGVTHLQSVLRAYCLHNPGIGYCQGMNFLVATALLFMSPEDAFWFLVAVTERYFDESYFDQSLTGAQADQEVLKEIVEQKFPRLAEHLDECEIDLTTVTLNWFIALFFDAVPFQTMLRLWDCFLFEGPKVLFRFTIALLGLHEEQILAHSDTISVIKVLKAAVRLTLDVDGLIKFAYNELNPFPSKAYLRQRQSLYLRVLQEQLHKRLQLRKLLNVTNVAQSDQLCDLPIEVVVFSPFVQGRGYVCAGNQKRGKMSLIQLHEEAANLNTLELEFDCRPVSMVVFQKEMAFVSLLSGYIVAVHLDAESGEAEILWELKLNDVALKLVHCSQRLYSCLANGTLAVLENAFERMPSALDLYHIPIAAAPITDALLDEEHLYLAVACKVVVLNRNTLSTVASVYVASAAVGSQVPMFEKIRALAQSPYGIWLVTAHSSLLQLWRGGQCEMLFDIRYDHSHRKPSFDEDDQLDGVEVYCVFYHSDELWVGTIDGYLMLYRVVSNEVAAPSSRSPMAKCRPPSSSKYQPGKRLSAAHGLSQPVPANRQQTYYIPTESETKVEERNSSMEMENERQLQGGRKISVKIDQLGRKYSVNVRHLSIDSAHPDAASLLHSSNGVAVSSPSAIASPPISRFPSSSCRSEPALRSITSRRPLLSQQSVDSALSSVFGSNSTAVGENGVAKKLSGSLGYEDFFETYYEEDAEEEEEAEAEERAECGRMAEEQRRRRFPSRLVRIHSWRKISAVSASLGSTPHVNVDEAVLRRRCNSASVTTDESGPEAVRKMAPSAEGIRIRRKDLNFDEPLLLAVKDGDALPSSLGASPPSRRMSRCELGINGAKDCAAPGEVETTEINSSLGMALQMKLKVADKPVRCISLGHFNGRDVVITGAGEYGDEEALLRWHRDPNSSLWINDPLTDIGVRGRKRTLFGTPASPKSPAGSTK